MRVPKPLSIANAAYPPVPSSNAAPVINRAWLAILGLTLLTALLLTVKVGSLLNYIFPLSAFGVGIYLYRGYPVMYISYCWWISFLAPWVRRLADWRSVWTDPSPILLAPVLVSLISITAVYQHLPKLYNRKGGLAFFLAIASISYSLVIGWVNRYSTNSIILGFLGWLNPILIGFYLYIHWQDYPQYRQNLQRTFFWAVLLIGLYGAWQYFSPTEWDKAWLTNVRTEKGIVSFGTPEPQGIRVFSTMNSPQTLGAGLMAGLILLFSYQKNPLTFPTLGIGYLTFLLSSARAAWLSWGVALLLYLPLMKQHLQIRLIIGLAIASLFVMPLTMVEPFSGMISDRVATLSDVRNDDSYNDRLSAYTSAMDEAMVEVLGKGMGLPDTFGAADNGLLTLMFTLGWVGVVPYLVGLFSLFQQAFSSPYIRQDAFACATLAIAFGSFEQIISNVATTGVLGMVVWGFLGITLAGDRYYRHQVNQALFLQGHEQ